MHRQTSHPLLPPTFLTWTFEVKIGEMESGRFIGKVKPDKVLAWSQSWRYIVTFWLSWLSWVCAVEFVLFFCWTLPGFEILEFLFWRFGIQYFWKGQVKTPNQKTARSYQYKHAISKYIAATRYSTLKALFLGSDEESNNGMMFVPAVTLSIGSYRI